MMEHLQKAYEFDIHVRRDVDEKLSPEGIKFTATDVHQGTVYQTSDVKVTAFLVDHGPVKPAFGYRVDYHGHSVALSGDTTPSQNLVNFSAGVDVLIHEVGGSKQDPALVGPPNEVPLGYRGRGLFLTRQQLRTVFNHHTDPEEAGRVFDRVKPKLAVFSHGGSSETIPLVRRTYSGPVEVGEDMMTIDIGDSINVRRFDPTRK
jgi:ribonuclease Z